MSSPAHSARHALVFEHLPKTAQSLVRSFVSTPSCPAHVLLARVSKSWAAEAAQQFLVDGASIQLEISCSTDYPLSKRQQEVERLEGLAAWLHRSGHLLNTLAITAAGPDGEPEDEYVLEAGQVVPSILAALAAAGKRPGGLRLQQLRMPAFPSTNIFTICRALSGCHKLRELHLGYSYSGQSTPAALNALEQLSRALQQLTQLVVLRLDGLFEYPHLGMDQLFRHLPSSLEVVEVCGCHPASRLVSTLPVAATSLQHLTAMKSLKLPDDTRVSTSSSNQGNPLTQLTALTKLHCMAALLSDGAPLLELPNLVQLVAGQAHPDHLDTLRSTTALRSLGVVLSPSQHEAQAATLAQLTQLVGLGAMTVDPDEDCMCAPEDIDEAGGEEEMLEAAGEAWGTSLASLTGLHSLITEPRVLKHLDLAPHTALTILHIDLLRCDAWYGQDELEELLLGLAPARGRIECVTLEGAGSFDEAGCCEALDAALGGDVMFACK